MFFSENTIHSVIIGFNYLYRIQRYAKKIKKVSRCEKVTSIFISRVVRIHNGQRFKNCIVRKGALNQPYGSLFHTKKFGSQIHVKKKTKRMIKKKK